MQLYSPMAQNEAILSEKSAITLAVFPFENLTAGKDFEIFCKSFCIDLITELSRFGQFQIIAYQTVKDLHPTESIEDQAVHQLHTDYFVKGSFRSDKGRMRINAQLFESRTHRLVWANRFEGDSAALQEIQEDLHMELVASLQQQLNYDLLSQIRKKPKVQLKAYEFWVYGIEELKNGSIESDLKAREYFQQAIALEPEYSLAYSGMSMTYFNEWSCQLWDRWNVCRSEAYEWAQKAIELDDQNYIASLVLGKIFLFEGSYETAEYFLRKSIQLNSNDPETLMPIASYFMYLGLTHEAVQLYEKALRLNPVNSASYYSIGAFIYLELGEFEKAASLAGRSTNSGWADAEAYNAAIYFYLNDYPAMEARWKSFLATYGKVVKHGADFTQEEAIAWLLEVNPHKHQSKLQPFLEFISDGKMVQPATSKAGNKDPDVNEFIKERGAWRISFERTTVLIPEVKGFYDIMRLLTQPDAFLHCTELMGSVLESEGQPLLDDKARKSYRKELHEIQQEIEEAESNNQIEQVSALQEKYDQLIDHLSQSLGLRGKSRETGNPVEKARSAVTWRIRNAIAKIELAHPALGKHLSNAIKTGTVCRYTPDKAISWVTSMGPPVL
jgi:TolB-like protein/tetratricopeptide (TPR) repeat protein